MGYGTGAIMAVPCGDQRDFEFARVFGLDIPPIQRPPDEWFADRGIAPTLDTDAWPEAFVGDAPYVNSANDDVDLNGTTSVAAGTAAVNAWLEGTGVGEATITYKLRDWLFSRQRYWGEPFPIVYDVDGIPHALPDADLPLTAAGHRSASRRGRSTPTTSSPSRRARSTAWPTGSRSRSTSATASRRTAATPT